MVSALISRVVILVFGTLYPAYASYKAVKTKNVKEYVKWMMYWIVFALFTTIETFADVLVSWFPFYYELKIAFVVWLLSPATKGSSILYRKFVHPELMKREADIDQTLDRVKTQGYSALVNVGQQGLNFAVQKAVTGQNRMLDHIMKKSFSMGDISGQHPSRNKLPYQPETERIPEANDETDMYNRTPHEYDMYSHDPIIPPQTSKVEVTQVQGGDGRVPAPSAPPTERVPVIDARSQSGYNLRSHEYHGAADHKSSKPTYHHEDINDPDLPVSESSLETESTTSTLSVEPSSLSNDSHLPNKTHQPKPPSARRRRSRSRSAGRKRLLVKKPSSVATRTTNIQTKALSAQH